MLIVPNVTMNGGIRSAAIIVPFTSPMIAPARRTRMTVGIVPNSRCISNAPTTLVNAMLDPAERSMPPLTMIIVIAIAPIATITVCVKMILKL